MKKLLSLAVVIGALAACGELPLPEEEEKNKEPASFKGVWAAGSPEAYEAIGASTYMNFKDDGTVEIRSDKKGSDGNHYFHKEVRPYTLNEDNKSFKLGLSTHYSCSGTTGTQMPAEAEAQTYVITGKSIEITNPNAAGGSPSKTTYQKRDSVPSPKDGATESCILDIPQ